MVEELVHTKIRSLMRCLARIESRRPATAEALAADLDLQDILVVNLERAVQMAVDITAHVIADRGLPVPANMKEGFSELRQQGWITERTANALKGAAGFRNVAVHEYQKLNWNVVHGIASNHLDDFRRFVSELKDQGILPL